MSYITPLLNLSGLKSLFALSLRPELKELYQFSLFYSFAYSLIVIFEPVFLYTQGFSLSFIALYYAIHYTIYCFLLPLGGKFASRFGFEHSLVTSLPLFVLYFLTLATVPEYPWLIWVAIVLLTAQKTFYWPAYHANFAKYTDGGNTGTELSWMRALQFGVGISGPVAGGFIAARFGFPILFIITAGIAMCAVVPLLRTKEQFRVRTFSYVGSWRMLVSRAHRRMVVAMMGMGENLIAMVFWPIFMFFVLESTSLLGTITSVSVAVMTAVGFLIGEVSDRFSRRYVLRLHLPFMVIGSLFRPLAGGFIPILLADTFNRMAFAGVDIPMTHRIYSEGKKYGVLEYTISFEMALCIAKAATAFLLVGVFFFAPTIYAAFVITFILAALFALLYAVL